MSFIYLLLSAFLSLFRRSDSSAHQEPAGTQRWVVSIRNHFTGREEGTRIVWANSEVCACDRAGDLLEWTQEPLHLEPWSAKPMSYWLGPNS